MSNRYHLTQPEIDKLEYEHRQTSDKRSADRLKAVYLLGIGWQVNQVAQALMIDRESVRNHHKRYCNGGLMALLRNEAGGSKAALNSKQCQQLTDYLQTHLCLTAKQVAHYVQQTWQVIYSESGITQLLHRLGFVYKKPKLIPGKADVDRQRDFIETYRKLKANKQPEDRIYFMDATHPHHNPIAGYGWIKRGKTHEIRSNTGRQRLNINGVIDCDDLSVIVRYDDTINAQSTIKLFQQIEAQNPQAGKIHIICDNARYYHAELVKDYLKASRIKLVFLPPYAPNLNLIERFWKFFKKTVLYGRYYETFCLFKAACDQFFAELDQHHASLRSLLTDRFQIIGQG
ncbi:MAG: IS630 family transposase [Methylococcales bacterium]|nr:IS630 family transposase [Methylococcales bacterium]